jgi:hypothetical protein
MEETFSVANSTRARILCFLWIVAVAVGPIPGLLSGQQPTTPQLPTRIDPQARQLLDRAIQALGGQAFLSAKSLTSRGRMFFFRDGRAAGMEPFESCVQYPDKSRLVIARNKKNISMLGGSVTYEGETKAITLINNGDKGWELDQMGLIAQPDQQIQNWKLANRYSLENLLRLRINEPGVLVQMGKVDFVDNVPVQGIEIFAAGGTSVRLDLHGQTFLPSRISYRIRNVKEDAWDEYSDSYSDYRMVDGIQVAMHIMRYLNGDLIAERFRNYVKFNEDYPPKYFTAE